MDKPAVNLDLKAIFPKGIYGIIYDCDGVMIDSADANRYLYNSILKSLGLAPLTPQQEQFAFQATFMQALEVLVPPKFHSQLETIAASTINYEKDVLPKIKLMPHYREFVDTAFYKGLHQAIDTNRTEFGIKKILEKFGLPPYFSPVINCSIAAPKPAPDGVNMILKSWGISPSEALFIGDSVDDKMAAHGAGVVFASFNNADLVGDMNISSWNELGNILWQ